MKIIPLADRVVIKAVEDGEECTIVRQGDILAVVED
ncbi:Uncharacterised protein [uncultured Clostridium sp.]|nr:Uncharacterised protein [uncultured Clostridium sp.]